MFNLHDMHKECELLIPDYGNIPIVIQIGEQHYEVKLVTLDYARRDGTNRLVLNPGEPV